MTREQSGWDEEERNRQLPIREHLQYWLVGSLHYAYVDAGDAAIKALVAGRPDEQIPIPDYPLASGDCRDLFLDREVATAAEIVERWQLGELVEALQEDRWPSADLYSGW